MSNKLHAAGTPVRALLIDDDEFMRELIVHTLHELNVHDITTASDGAQGVAAYDSARSKPNLILCDLHMPGQDGFQFMNTLAQRGYGGGIILVSGMEARTLKSATLMAQFHELNILATLEKPIDKNALAEAIAKLN